MQRRALHLVLLAVLLVIVTGCASLESRLIRAVGNNDREALEKISKEDPKGKYGAEARAAIERLDFEAAKRANTIKAWEDFSKAYPRSRYATETQAQLERLYFQQAQQRNTAEAFEDFLRKYPTSQYAAAVRAQLEPLHFQDAKRVNTAEAFKDFLRKYPTSQYAPEAQAQLEVLRFQDAKRVNTIKAWEDFVKAYPSSQYAAEAQAQLEALRFQDAKRVNTIKAWEDFVGQHPDSRQAPEARAQLETLYFQQAQQRDTIDAYQDYLRRYPTGRFVRESQAKIAALRAPTPYVLYFYFAPERCPHCRAMAPVIERFYREYGIARGDTTPRAFLDHPPIQLAALVSDLLLPRLVQDPRKKERYEVYGVPIRGWGDPDVFRRATGITFPIVGSPGLAVDTDRHPVTVLHNKQTHVTRVAAVGAVSYSDIVGQTTSFTKGEATTRVRGAA